MITLSHHSERYLALRNCFEHKDRIKMLADYPDVRWDKQSGAWLVDNRMYEELSLAVGKWMQGTPDFWCDFHTYEPQPVQRRKTKRELMAQKAQDKVAAGKFGAAILAMKEGAK